MKKPKEDTLKLVEKLGIKLTSDDKEHDEKQLLKVSICLHLIHSGCIYSYLPLASSRIVNIIKSVLFFCGPLPPKRVPWKCIIVNILKKHSVTITPPPPQHELCSLVKMINSGRPPYYRNCTRNNVSVYVLCILATQPFFSFAYPDIAALTDLPYISRSSAFRPNLQTLAPIQSST